MLEVVVSALLTVVFEKLASAALTKVRSKKIHSDLEESKSFLLRIQDLLDDASDKEIKKRSVKEWLNRLQHLAYDIDDVLDSLATDALAEELAAGKISTKVKKFTSTFSPSTSTSMHDKLKKINNELQKLFKERNELGLELKGEKPERRQVETSLLPPRVDIVGREDEKQNLVKKLLADPKPHDQYNFSIVPIVGMGGVGKTTLAKLLYNEPEVKQRFDLKAWVCVSNEFNSVNIGNSIFQSIAGEEKKQKTFTDLTLLQEDLTKELAGNKFLLVLDDMWSERIEDWDKLVLPFHAVAPGSKIIITTRKEQLLQQLGYDNPYRLNKLSDDDSLSLFAHYALNANNFDSKPTLRPHGEAIVQKCKGLPLALKALGRLLSTKTREEEWKELLDNEIWRLDDSEIWRLEDGAVILPALKLSYLDLPARLKLLFAYTCLFPKDYVFEKEELIWLWMAEGFLQKSTKSELMEMERLGEIYFDQLLSRSFFEYADNDKSLFVMHDLMNDLATYVAGEFFVRLDIEMKNKYEGDGLKSCRHMSFVREKFMAFKKFQGFERANTLRTFLAVPVVVRDGWESFNLSKKILVDLLPHLPLLRVLCLSKLQIDEVPESVGDLKHLRYLNLSQTQITCLPENVCNLYNLETLIAFGCRKLRKLPDRFTKLKNLRHFDIRGTPLLKSMPLGIGELQSLQSLSKIIIGGENEFPKSLKNLRQRISIHGLDKFDNGDQARKANLFQMSPSELEVEWGDVFDGSRKEVLDIEVLNVLKPDSDDLRELKILSYRGREFPKWVGDSLFCKLTVVRMYKCRNCMFLPPLGQLPSLKKLSIESMDEVKEVGSELLGNGPAAFRLLEILDFEDMPRWEEWSTDITGFVDGVFPCLKKLTIRNCCNMAGWEVLSDSSGVVAFPCLEELWINKCPNLVKVSVEVLPSLRDLRIWDCGEGVLKSLVGVASSSITKLSIEGISGLSDEVWGDVVPSLGALEELTISQCNEIRNLWESEEEEACKEVLVNLKKLHIYECGNLVRIGGGGGEKEEEEGSNLLLTSLRMLSIRYLKNLKHLSCPDNIETLNIFGCWNLEHLSCPANSIQELSMYDCSSITSVSFPTEGGGWQNLKSLVIKGCKSEVLGKELEKQVLKNIPPMLQVLDIQGWENLKSITEFNGFIQQITRLEIEDCGRIESFPNLQNLTSLKHLTIKNCPRMDGPPPLTSVSGVWPPKLRSLTIGKLKRPISEWGPLPTSSSLVQLWLFGGFGSSSSAEEEEDVKTFPTSSLLIPSSSSSLTTLELWGFKKMERISSEGLQHLTSLQHLDFYDCPKMKDLPETLLPSLLSLRIRNCPNLKEKMMSRSRWPRISHIPKVDISHFAFTLPQFDFTLP